MQESAWYSSIARVVAIVVAVGLYAVALIAILKRTRKSRYIPRDSSASTQAGYSGPERRIYPRARLEIPVRYKSYSSSGAIQIFREGRTRDIGEGGLLMETSEQFSVNDKLEFKLKLPFVFHFMLVRGNVIWRKEVEKDKWYSYGISFIEIDPNDRKQIAKYVINRQLKDNK